MLWKPKQNTKRQNVESTVETMQAAENQSGGSGQSVQVSIRLQPVNHSNQPILSNFAMVQGAPGMVFLDFGFLEPNALSSVARLAQSGQKVPEGIVGHLGCRVALGLDTASNLARQLNQLLRGATAQPQPQAAPTSEASIKPDGSPTVALPGPLGKSSGQPV